MKNGSKRGYTLIEILLVTFLILLFSSLFIINLGFHERLKTENAVSNITTLLRFSRAEAENTGKHFQVDLSENVTNVLCSETNPLTESGVYTTVHLYIADDIISDLASLNIDTTNKINFYPDGSCDSISLIISSKIDTNIQYKIILDGEIGRIRQEIIDVEESSKNFEDPQTPLEF